MDDDDLFATPEEAALAGMADVPARYLRVAAVTYSRGGDEATVELSTNEEPSLYTYYVHCDRDVSGRWSEGYSHN